MLTDHFHLDLSERNPDISCVQEKWVPAENEMKYYMQITLIESGNKVILSRIEGVRAPWSSIVLPISSFSSFRCGMKVWKNRTTCCFIDEILLKAPFTWCNSDCDKTVSRVNVTIEIHETHSEMKLFSLSQQVNILAVSNVTYCLHQLQS